MVKIREGLPLIDGQADQYTLNQHHSHQPNQNHNHSDNIDDLIRQLDNDYQGERSDIFATGIGMTDILSYLYQDEDALVSAMLYRSARHNLIDNKTIEQKFGSEISTLVTETLAIGKLSETIEKSKRLEDHFANNQREQLNNIYSMLISVTNDVRVVLIKLAERTFAMRELSCSPEERQQRVAREVMTIYAPLAHRLGIAQIKQNATKKLPNYSLKSVVNERNISSEYKRNSKKHSLQQILKVKSADESNIFIPFIAK